MTTYSPIQKHATLKHYTKWCDIIKRMQIGLKWTNTNLLFDTV